MNITLQTRPIKEIKLNPRNARTHSAKQIRQIANSIVAFGFTNPLLVSERGELIAGHGRYKAAQLLGLVKVPVIAIAGLSPARQRALAVADNKIAGNAGWDRERLAIEIPELTGLLEAEGLDASILGFEAVEIDQLLNDFEENAADPQDDIDSHWCQARAISKPGDLWVLGHHKLLCGDARSAADVARVMANCRADLAFLDPPYNVRIGAVVGRGRTKHSEFAMASGEMSSAEYLRFLCITLEAAASVSREGAVHFVCMDWRHIAELLAAAKLVYGDVINIAVWVKSNAGQGSFYRSQHEFIGIFRVGEAPHLNNIELGRHGRSRSNVWHYTGVNSFRAGRMEELRSHPSSKPVALVADAIKDCTRRGDVILDTFAGSGTTIMAAERVGRHARALEIEPRFVDVAIRRWQAFAGRDAHHAANGLSFDEIAADSPAGKSAARRGKRQKMKGSSAPPKRRVRKPNRRMDSQTGMSDQEYRVGPGHPPKEYQFKPGQSGNPEGARRKPRSIAPDLKALFEHALSTMVTLRQGEKEKIISKAAAGIEQLVNQFAKGDRHARRDLLMLAQTLGVDLAAGQGDIGQAVAAALSANDEALLADYVRRHSSQGDLPDDANTDGSTVKTSNEPVLHQTGRK